MPDEAPVRLLKYRPEAARREKWYRERGIRTGRTARRISRDSVWCTCNVHDIARVFVLPRYLDRGNDTAPRR